MPVAGADRGREGHRLAEDRGVGVQAASAVVVTVAAWLTAWLSAVEVLAVKLLSPP